MIMLAHAAQWTAQSGGLTVWELLGIGAVIVAALLLAHPKDH